MGAGAPSPRTPTLAEAPASPASTLITTAPPTQVAEPRRCDTIVVRTTAESHCRGRSGVRGPAVAGSARRDSAVLPPQGRLHDLAAGVARQAVHDVQDGRQLVAGQPDGTPLAQFVQRQGCARGED